MLIVLLVMLQMAVINNSINKLKHMHYNIYHVNVWNTYLPTHAIQLDRRWNHDIRE